MIKSKLDNGYIRHFITAMKMQIRCATLKDLDAIKDIALSAYQQYVDILGKKPAPMIADFVNHLENDAVFVAEDSFTQKLIGYAVIINKKGDYWLENIAVMPSSTKKGIGTKLIAHVENYIAQRAAQYQLYTNVNMTGNIDWYNRIGFEETKRLSEDGFERVFFRKKLNKRG